MPKAITATETVEGYFQALVPERRRDMLEVRNLIQRIWPAMDEELIHGIPTYRLDGEPLCALASQKSFMVLYFTHYDLLHAFKNDLKVHDTGKSCIRFRKLEPATLDLFDRIIKYTGNQMALSGFYGRPGTHRFNSNGRGR